MNDERAGQLCGSWTIPPYARDQLWVDSDSGCARCEGEKGIFDLNTPATILTLRWGSADGVPLTQFLWQPDHFGWAGQVRLGGMVEAIHLAEMPGMDDTMLAVIIFSAQPLRPKTTPYPTADRRNQKMGWPAYGSGVDDEFDPQPVTLLALYDSPLTTTAQEALLHRSPLYVYGRLADEKRGWHRIVALPIVWEAVTLFTP